MTYEAILWNLTMSCLLLFFIYNAHFYCQNLLVWNIFDTFCVTCTKWNLNSVVNFYLKFYIIEFMLYYVKLMLNTYLFEVYKFYMTKFFFIKNTIFFWRAIRWWKNYAALNRFWSYLFNLINVHIWKQYLMELFCFIKNSGSKY